MEHSRLAQYAVYAMGEHWAHNAAHITDGMDEEVFFINRLWAGFDSHHPLHHILPTRVSGSRGRWQDFSLDMLLTLAARAGLTPELRLAA